MVLFGNEEKEFFAAYFFRRKAYFLGGRP